MHWMLGILRPLPKRLVVLALADNKGKDLGSDQAGLHLVLPLMRMTAVSVGHLVQILMRKFEPLKRRQLHMIPLNIFIKHRAIPQLLHQIGNGNDESSSSLKHGALQQLIKAFLGNDHSVHSMKTKICNGNDASSTAVQSVESLVFKGAVDYRSFPMLLKHFVPSLSTQLSDRRSSKVKHGPNKYDMHLVCLSVSSLYFRKSKFSVYGLNHACVVTSLNEFGKRDQTEANFVILQIKNLSADSRIGGEPKGTPIVNHLLKDNIGLASYPRHRIEMLSTISMQTSILLPTLLDRGSCLSFQAHASDSMTSHQVQYVLVVLLQIQELADRISALQQTVSSFGKTDTASVLMEVINYIRFLEEQVRLLSDLYMKLNGNMLNYLVVGNESPSILICFSLKTNNAGQITSKLHVIELGAQSDHHYYHLAFFTTRKVEAYEELTWVALFNQIKIAFALMDHGANVECKNAQGWILGNGGKIAEEHITNGMVLHAPLLRSFLEHGLLYWFRWTMLGFGICEQKSLIHAEKVPELLCGLTAMDCAVGLLFALQPILGGSSVLFYVNEQP
ncbi:hypothetical protein J5N97_023395 [Dioscorea zingiberensis]|uniref:BHLH domain-containing protein n=1 Tax=Dioscorea zingiberensis TaxID=325984 RepID=A0A9D5C560_9LILI|nr:hypothetical protein J5N97_023395 [Dioscorea zingiberensis]